MLREPHPNEFVFLTRNSPDMAAGPASERTSSCKTVALIDPYQAAQSQVRRDSPGMPQMLEIWASVRWL
jgi:hypothetical protein